MMRIAALYGFAGACLLAWTAAAAAADLIVNVSGLSSSEGIARVVVIADPDGHAHQDASRNVPLADTKDHQLTTTFLGLTPGRYGVVVIEESAVNHAIEKAVTGTVAAPKASSKEVRFTLSEPKSVVTVALDPAGK